MPCKNCITLKVLLEHNYTADFDFDKSLILQCKVCKKEILLYEYDGKLEIEITKKE